MADIEESEEAEEPDLPEGTSDEESDVSRDEDDNSVGPGDAEFGPCSGPAVSAGCFNVGKLMSSNVRHGKKAVTILLAV